MLFGAVSSATHYNWFAIISSVSATKILGVPVLNYFDDFWALSPDVAKEFGMEVYLMFTSKLGDSAKGDKSEVSRVSVFLD